MIPDPLARLALRLGDDAFLMGSLSFFGASLAGLAAQLRTGKKLTARSILAALLNSGMLGLIIFLLGHQSFQDDMAYLVGMSLLSGIGGATLMDFFIELARRGLGIRISIDQPKRD